MFDTMKVAQKIREARNVRNMTQMALADEMGVSYQAVSNWERGNSMPDISKLEQLCNVLHITIYELLGSDDHQARTVSKILRDEELPEAEEVAEIAPIVPPKKIKEAVSETAKKRQVNWNAIMNMAPFLDSETLDEILQNVEPGDYKHIISLAPFLGKDTMDKLVDKLLETGDAKGLEGLYPFLGRDTMRKLVQKMMESSDFDAMRDAAQFL